MSNIGGLPNLNNKRLTILQKQLNSTRKSITIVNDKLKGEAPWWFYHFNADDDDDDDDNGADGKEDNEMAMALAMMMMVAKAHKQNE